MIFCFLSTSYIVGIPLKVTRIAIERNMLTQVSFGRLIEAQTQRAHKDQLVFETVESNGFIKDEITIFNEAVLLDVNNVRHLFSPLKTVRVS